MSVCKKAAVVTILFVLVASEVTGLDLSLLPGMEIPVGPAVEGVDDLYSIGAGGTLVLAHTLATPPWLHMDAGLGYYRNDTSGRGALSRLSLELGAGLLVVPISRVNVRATAFGGYTHAFYDGQQGSGALFGARLGASYSLTSSLLIGLAAAYRNTPNLYNGISVSLSAGLAITGGRESRSVDFIEAQTEPLFPILYQSYGGTAFGQVTMKNVGTGNITDVSVAYFMPEYMSVPTRCAEYSRVDRGQEVTVPLRALFSERILGITEGQNVPAEITVTYTYLGKEYTNTHSHAVRVLDRNATTWDDDRKVAAFVTAKNPQVMRFARNTAAVPADSAFGSINKQFRQAMATLEALRIHGMTYVPDPQTPYEQFSQQEQALDYLQFPTQSLSFRSGDCDDLSILYNALLESMGVETAFITIPGHIYPAFGIDIWPEEARRFFRDPDELIIRGETVWIPVEVTILQQGFLAAWQIGARQWREAERSGEAAFYPTRECWDLYAPVANPDADDAALVAPESETVSAAYGDRMKTFVELSIASREQALTERIERGENIARNRNALGVLYARHGLLEKAEQQFLALSPRATVFVNLGNIAFVRGRMAQAIDYYESALEYDPSSSKALLGYARAKYQSEDYVGSERALVRLVEQDPELAEEYAYLGSVGSTTRASSADGDGFMLWAE